MRALIVDDSRFVRGYLRGLLEEKGIECEEAADGQAGMEQLKQSPSFDLALVASSVCWWIWWARY